MKKSLLIIASALALFACANQETVRTAQPGDVKFTSNIQTYTLKATDVAFENGDKVGIFAGAPISKNNVEATVEGTSLNHNSKIKWVDGDNSVVDFYAYYPYAEGTGKTISFAVAANQNVENGYAKSDLMIASAKSGQTENAIALNFKHALSKVSIGVVNNIPETSITKVAFEGVALNGNVSIEDGVISELGEKANITARSLPGGYDLILMPQTATPKVRVSLSNAKDYVFELAGAFTFKPGKKASASLTIDAAAQGDAVLFTLDVVNWEDDAEALEFGKPDEEEAHTWSVIGLNDDWETDIPMTLNAAGKWELTIDYIQDNEFKLRADNDWTLNAGIKTSWENNVFISGDNPDPYLEEGSPRNIKLEAAGQYKLEFEYPSYKFVVTKIEQEPVEPTTVTLTVNVYSTTGWEALYLYTWQNETPICGEWPGLAPAATDVVVNEIAYKSFVIKECPTGVIGYILNNNAGAQTADLFSGNIKEDTTVYLWLKNDATVELIEKPETFVPGEEEPVVEEWTIVGSFTNWADGDVMTVDPTNANAVKGHFTSETDAEFKIKVVGTSWVKWYGPASGETTAIDLNAEYTQLAINADGNLTIGAGTYDVTLVVAGTDAGKLYIEVAE